MADLRRFGLVDFLLLVLTVALAGGARAGYLITCCDSGRSAGPLRVEDKRPSLPGAEGRTDLDQLVEGVRDNYSFKSQSLLSRSVVDTAHTAPGYPYVVGLLKRAMGDADFERAVRWGQCGLGTLTAALYFLFARRAFGSLFVATVAGIFCALHPFWVIDTATIEDGVLSTFLLSAVMFFGVRGIQASGAFSSLLYGLTLAALALVRAALLPFSVVAFLWFLLRCRSMPRGWLCGLLALLGFANGLTPWTVRNWKQFGEVLPIVDSTYLSLWGGNSPNATGGPPNASDERTLTAGLNGQPRSFISAELSVMVEKEVERDQVVAVNRRLAAMQYFFLGERWSHNGHLAEEVASAAKEDARVAKEDGDGTMPSWLARSYPGALSGSLFAMLVLGLLGWRWTYGWRFHAMPSSIAMVWIPLPYILSHADALAGPRLPLDGVMLCYAAFAVGCFIPRLSTRLLEGPRQVVVREAVVRH